jgi:hypothetical protein
LAAILLGLAGCNRAAASAGGNQSANAATPAAAPASAAPTADNVFLVGCWTDTGDCSNATDFDADGQFRTSNGTSGQWNLAGNRLTPPGVMTPTAQVVAIDRNTLEIVNPEGSRGRSMRC